MAGALVAGAYFVAWFFLSGWGGAVVQVDFNHMPELEGASVFIDGDSAGTLFGRGRQRLSGFRVGLGEHRVFLRHPGHVSDTATVQADLRAAQYLVYAYPGRRRGPDRLRSIRILHRLPD